MIAFTIYKSIKAKREAKKEDASNEPVHCPECGESKRIQYTTEPNEQRATWCTCSKCGSRWRVGG